MTPEEQAVLDAAAAAEAKKRPEYTAEEQAHIQKLIDQRFAKIADKHSVEVKTLQEQLAAAQAELEDARKGGKGKPNSQSEDDEIKKQTKALLDNEKGRAKAAEEAAKAKEQELTVLRGENKRILKTQAIRDAAANMINGLQFHDLKLVQTLVENDIDLDSESNQWVVKVNGVVKNNSSMEPMSLSEYFAEFAAARPFLVKGQTKGGAGSSESSSAHVGGVGVVRCKADLKTVKDKVEYVNKFGELAFAKLPLK